MFVKGQPRPEGSGRKRGTPNRATVQRRLAEAAGVLEQMKAIQSTEMPLDFLLRQMRDPAAAPADRFAAARVAAAFCHPQLQAVGYRHLGSDGAPLTPTISVTIVKAAPEPPKLSHQGPKDETVQ
jgi:hypothetical protein